MFIIGISGHIGTGKSTLALALGELETHHREVVVSYSFGAAIKRETAREFEFPAELAFSEVGKKTKILVPQKYQRFFKTAFITVREAVQWYGTDYVRAINPRYWTVKAQAFFEDNKETADICIVDDLRTREEAWLIRNYPSLLVRLEHYPGYVSDEANEHKIEKELDSYDDWNLRFAPVFGPRGLSNAAVAIRSVRLSVAVAGQKAPRYLE